MVRWTVVDVLRNVSLWIAAAVSVFWVILLAVLAARKDRTALVVFAVTGIVALVLVFFTPGAVGILISVLHFVVLVTSIRIIPEYARGVVFRFGRLHGVLEAGFNVVLPLGVDSVRVIDLRTVSMDVPKQEIITKDNVPVLVDAVVYFNVQDPVLAVTKVANYVTSTSLLGMTTLRSVLGQYELDEMLAKRAELNEVLRGLLDKAAGPWGVKVSMVELKALELPDSMKRAMARQAEAERERRGKVIAADGELQASQKLAEAASIISSQPAALQLRYLQTLTEIAAEHNSTIVFPLPLELLEFLRGSK